MFTLLKPTKIKLFSLFWAASIIGGYTDSLADQIAYECTLSGLTANELSGCVSDSNIGTPTVAVTGDGSCSGSFCGAKADGWAIVPIDVWNTCRWVDDDQKPLFVPFRTAREWQDFLAAAASISGITLTHCGVPYSRTNAPATTVVTPPYANCSTASTDSPNVYGRTAASVWPEHASSKDFTCHDGATAIQSRLQFIAGDADTTASGSLSWTPNFVFSPDLTLTITNLTTGETGTAITIPENTPISLAWTTSASAVSCLATGGWTGLKEPRGGAVTLTPQGNASYTLACSDNVGLTSTATATLNTIGLCGTDSNQTLASTPTNLCGAECSASNLATNPNGWTWNCAPNNGGGAASCKANVALPSCGSVNGTTVSDIPTTGLCTVGTPSSVDESNPLTWTCSTGDGAALHSVNCTANYCQHVEPKQEQSKLVWGAAKPASVWSPFLLQNAIWGAGQGEYGSGTLSCVIRAPAAGTYTMRAGVDNWGTFSVNGQMVLDLNGGCWASMCSQYTQEWDVPVWLNKGRNVFDAYYEDRGALYGIAASIVDGGGNEIFNLMNCGGDISYTCPAGYTYNETAATCDCNPQ